MFTAACRVNHTSRYLTTLVTITVCYISSQRQENNLKFPSRKRAKGKTPWYSLNPFREDALVPASSGKTTNCLGSPTDVTKAWLSLPLTHLLAMTFRVTLSPNRPLYTRRNVQPTIISKHSYFSTVTISSCSSSPLVHFTSDVTVRRSIVTRSSFSWGCKQICPRFQ